MPKDTHTHFYTCILIRCSKGNISEETICLAWSMYICGVMLMERNACAYTNTQVYTIITNNMCTNQ